VLIVDKIAKLYAETADVDVSKVASETVLREPDWMDSLDLAEFYMAVEEEFGVELPSFKCVEFETIGDVADHVIAEQRRQGV
jgi:acyl carrier protein